MSEVPSFDAPADGHGPEADSTRLKNSKDTQEKANLPNSASRSNPETDDAQKENALRTRRILESTATLKRYEQVLTPAEMQTLSIVIDGGMTFGVVRPHVTAEASSPSVRTMIAPIEDSKISIRRYGSVGLSFRKGGKGFRVTLEQAVHWHVPAHIAVPDTTHGPLADTNLVARPAIAIVRDDLNGVPEHAIRRGLNQIAHRIQQNDFDEKPRDLGDEVFEDDVDPEDHETSELLDTLSPELQDRIRDRLGDRIRSLRITSEISGKLPIQRGTLHVSYENGQGRRISRLRSFRFSEKANASAVRAGHHPVGSHQEGLERVLARLFKVLSTPRGEEPYSRLAYH